MDQTNSKALAFYNRSQDFVEVRTNEQQFPRLRNIAPEAAFPQVKAMVVGAAILRGAVMADSVIDLTAEAFLQEVRQDFPNLTLPELGKAIRNGCFEKYGQVYGLNAVSLYKMVQGYIESAEAEEVYRKAEETQKRNREKTQEFIQQHPDYFMAQAEDFVKEHQV